LVAAGAIFHNRYDPLGKLSGGSRLIWASTRSAPAPPLSFAIGAR